MMGLFMDFESEGLWCFVVNVCYWVVGMEDVIFELVNVDYVGEYVLILFGFGVY